MMGSAGVNPVVSSYPSTKTKQNIFIAPRALNTTKGTNMHIELTTFLTGYAEIKVFHDDLTLSLGMGSHEGETLIHRIDGCFLYQAISLDGTVPGNDPAYPRFSWSAGDAVLTDEKIADATRVAARVVAHLKLTHQNHPCDMEFDWCWVQKIRKHHGVKYLVVNDEHAETLPYLRSRAYILKKNNNNAES